MYKKHPAAGPEPKVLAFPPYQECALEGRECEYWHVLINQDPTQGFSEAVKGFGAALAAKSYTHCKKVGSISGKRNKWQSGDLSGDSCSLKPSSVTC